MTGYDWTTPKLEEVPASEGWLGISSLEEVGQQGGQGWRSRPTSSTQDHPDPKPGECLIAGPDVSGSTAAGREAEDPTSEAGESRTGASVPAFAPVHLSAAVSVPCAAEAVGETVSFAVVRAAAAGPAGKGARRAGFPRLLDEHVRGAW